MKTMSDWLSRAAALPARLHSNRRQSDNQCARDRQPFRSRVTAVFTRHDFVTTSCRAAISFVGANGGPHAVDSLTRVSSRVEFIEAEFNGTGARSPYIEHQGIRIGCCKQIARGLDSTLASRSVINSSRPTRVYNRSIQEKRK